MEFVLATVGQLPPFLPIPFAIVRFQASAFNRIAVNAKVPLQPRFSAPKRLVHTYPAGRTISSRESLPRRRCSR